MVRAELADLGETPAQTKTTHDCAQSPGGLERRATTTQRCCPYRPSGRPETWALSTDHQGLEAFAIFDLV
jgi:hypothetical protein